MFGFYGFERPGRRSTPRQKLDRPEFSRVTITNWIRIDVTMSDVGRKMSAVETGLINSIQQ